MRTVKWHDMTSWRKGRPGLWPFGRWLDRCRHFALLSSRRIRRKPAFLPHMPETINKIDILAMTAVGDSLLIVTVTGDIRLGMRFYDAVQELKAFDGIQTHRAWWVAKTAVRNVVRHRGKFALRLTNDRLVPVSRTYKKQLRRQGWI
jgi:DNA-binding LytR/AlgR family response regulator